MDEIKFQVPNDINVVISNKEKGVLLDENCCTVINIMLTNEGKIATSFLGTHNPFIVSQLERAQKEYFRVLKKTLKKDYKEYAEAPGFDDEDECDCGCGIHKKDVAYDDTCDCGCHHDHEKTCDCGPECDCGCNEGKPCTCEDEHCGCGCDHDKETKKKETKPSKSKKTCKKNK